MPEVNEAMGPWGGMDGIEKNNDKITMERKDIDQTELKAEEIEKIGMRAMFNNATEIARHFVESKEEKTENA